MIPFMYIIIVYLVFISSIAKGLAMSRLRGWPIEGTFAPNEVRAENDEILRQLQSTQAHISIWSLLASSSTHHDALIWALSQIRVETTTSPEGLIHMMMADRATCIVFLDDDLPPEGLDHTRLLYISVGCPGQRVPYFLLDNGSALNVCPLATAIALGYTLSDFSPSTQTVRAYDSTRREVIGTLEIDYWLVQPLLSPCFRFWGFLRLLTCFWANHGSIELGSFLLPFIRRWSLFMMARSSWCSL